MKTVIYQIRKALLRQLCWFWRYGIALVLYAIFIIAIIPGSTIQYDTVWERIAGATAGYQFDFISWELGAIGAKADGLLFGQVAYIAEDDRSQIVRDYMAELSQILSLEAQIAQVYNDPLSDDPATETQALRAQRDQQRRALQTQQTTVEAILEGQIATILVEEGFGTMGQLLPPMAMRFTRMPNLLVTSPRQTIRMENSLVIDALAIDERSALEAQVMTQFDVSAIVVPLGGIALYPAMIQETANLSFVIETFAHEWLHHYLYFHPLGISYFTGEGFSGDARTINETTADLFGKEIAGFVMARYYPELTPPPLPTPPTEASILEPAAPDPDAFDFAAEMNETRVRVDDLLVAGQVEAAEQYMEERRIVFYDNGFVLRRINQAFFAFYGGYQAGGGIAGAGGTDPIGPAVITIRQNSPSIRAFITTMQTITTREALLQTQSKS